MNDLYYGNISKENLPYLDVKNDFTNYFEEFSMIPYPNFFESLEENESILKVQQRAEANKDWEKIKQFIFLWDADFKKALEIFLEKINIPFDNEYLDYLTSLSEELGALVMQLKNHYQRARPYQYALYGNQKLNPYDTFSGNTPSYPSGHACQITFLGAVLISHYGEKEKEINSLAKKVIESRMILGVHFQSDNDFGIEIAKTLLEKEDIKKKYFDEND
jgi:hypothetical protein